MQTTKCKIKIFQSSPMIVGLGLILLLSGCSHLPHWPKLLPGQRDVVVESPSPRPYSTFVSPHFQSARPRRILMIESGAAYGNYHENQKLITELASQIRATTAFEIVTPPGVRLNSVPDNILHGDFDELEVVNVARQYNADAVAVVRVNNLRSHAPIRVGITMAIIDSNETHVTFAIDGIWDTAQPGLKNEFRNFNATHGGSATAASIHLQSPNQLFSFAAKQIAEVLAAN